MINYGVDPYTKAVILDAEHGIVRCEPPRTKVGIIGAGPGRSDAPWNDETWELWGLNEIYQKRATRWWECHPIAVQSARELAWLAQCPTPCYVLDLAECIGKVQNAVQFPRERLIAAGFREYWTCTFAMQMCLALHEGFEVIGLWGVELYEGTARERTIERACVDYWIGVADGRGVKIIKPPWMAAQPFLYGYHYDQEKRFGENEMERLAAIVQDEVRHRA